MFGLSLSESLTLVIAGYAAIVSTFVLGWDAYKWLNQGPKLKVTAQTGMKIVGRGQIDPKTYVSATVVNCGDRATTLTNMGFLFYESWFKAYFRRNRADQAFIITTPSDVQVLPYRFEAGAQWIGMADQDESVDRMIREGYLSAVIYSSTSGKGTRQLLARKEHSTVKEANPG